MRNRYDIEGAMTTIPTRSLSEAILAHPLPVAASRREGVSEEEEGSECSGEAPPYRHWLVDISGMFPPNPLMAFLTLTAGACGLLETMNDSEPLVLGASLALLAHTPFTYGLRSLARRVAG